MILGRTYDTSTLRKTSEQKLNFDYEINALDGDFVVLRELIEGADGMTEIGPILNTFCYRYKYKLDV